MCLPYPKYSVVIRTLGTAGEKYLQELQSIQCQTIQPDNIFVYIPFGYDLPKETIHHEKYIRCRKGMVAQRSLPFNEIKSEYILFLDDDVFLPNDAVKELFDALKRQNGDCIVPDTFANHRVSFRKKLINAFAGTFPHFNREWAFKIKLDGHFCYNIYPKKTVLLSQSGAFPIFLIKKEVYKAIHFEDERWMDEFIYTLGDDQMFFYKLYKYGYKLLVYYNTGIVHLNAQTARSKDKKIVDYNAKMLRYIMWHRSIYKTQPKIFKRCAAILSYSISFVRDILFHLLLCIKHKSIWPMQNLFKATIKAIIFCKSNKYKHIPLYMKWKDCARNY